MTLPAPCSLLCMVHFVDVRCYFVPCLPLSLVSSVLVSSDHHKFFHMLLGNLIYLFAVFRWALMPYKKASKFLQ